MSIIGGSRFLLVEKPLAYPFLDIVTKTSDGPLFDLSVDLDNFEGVPYVKAEHIEEMARTLGMATKEEVDALNERIRILEAENSRLPGESEELVNGINNLVADYRKRISIGGTIPADIPDSENDEESGESAGLSSSGNAGPDSNASESSGSSWKPDDRDDFETHELLAGIDGQGSGNVGSKGPNKLSASSSHEFGL